MISHYFVLDIMFYKCSKKAGIFVFHAILPSVITSHFSVRTGGWFYEWQLKGFWHAMFFARWSLPKDGRHRRQDCWKKGTSSFPRNSLRQSIYQNVFFFFAISICTLCSYTSDFAVFFPITNSLESINTFVISRDVHGTSTHLSDLLKQRNVNCINLCDKLNVLLREFCHFRA